MARGGWGAAEARAFFGRMPDRSLGSADRRGLRDPAPLTGGTVRALNECRSRPSSGGPPARSGCTPGMAACRFPVLDGTRARPGREDVSATPPSVRHTPTIAETPASRNRASGTCTPPDGRPFRSPSDLAVVSPSSPNSPVRILPGEWPAPELQSSARPGCLRKMAALRVRAPAAARGRDFAARSGFRTPVRSPPVPSPAAPAKRRSPCFDMIGAPK